MKKKPLTKHTFKLFAGQIDQLAALHPNLPVSETLRRIIDAYITRVEKQLGSAQKKVEVEFDV